MSECLNAFFFLFLFCVAVTRTLGFGLDIGGTLLKFVCFEPVDAYHHMEVRSSLLLHLLLLLLAGSQLVTSFPSSSARVHLCRRRRL